MQHEVDNMVLASAGMVIESYPCPLGECVKFSFNQDIAGWGDELASIFREAHVDNKRGVITVIEL